MIKKAHPPGFLIEIFYFLSGKISGRQGRMGDFLKKRKL